VGPSLNDIAAGFSQLSAPEQLSVVAEHGDAIAAAATSGELTAQAIEGLRAALVTLVARDVGMGRERLPTGILLGRLGDPRLRLPADPTYWVSLTLHSGDVFELGRFPVTNHEYKAWVDAGGYRDQAAWSEDGRDWRDRVEDPWPVLADRAESDMLLVPNQPVVGVTWFEADAYARANGARLPRCNEREFAVRGVQKRPYPWGSPFGEGNANTKEEVLRRPCAVGLYVQDRTPEGIYDLAGNVGEWTSEQLHHEFLLHPGSWRQPSLAAWAKALTTEDPTARGPDLGFRIARS
jgi:hypothetical protein